MEPHPSYTSVLLWSLIILLSFWGWGEALRRLLNRREFSDLGWGLTMAWGMAVTLALGGLFMAFSLATAPVLVGLVIAGALGAVLFLSAQPQNPAAPTEKKISQKSSQPHKPTTPALHGQDSRFDPLQRLALGALWALAALVFASSIAWPFQIDPNDDIVCYLFFPEKILQTGSLIEPFNVRRMGTYGGQSLLQALVMIVGGERNGHVPDRGFGALLLFGMLLHLTKALPPQASLYRLLVAGLVFLTAVPRINTGSSLTGAAILLALILTLEKVLNSSKVSIQHLLAPSLLIAAAGALRPTYLLCSAALATFAILSHAFLNSKTCEPAGRSSAIKNAFVALASLGLGSLLFLAPWMSVLWQSNQTPIYPPFLGTMNPEFAVLGSKDGMLQDVLHAFSYLLSADALVLLLCLALAVIVRPAWLSIPSAIVVIAVSWLTSYKFGVTVLFESYRYTFPMLFPVAVWLLAKALPGAERDENAVWKPFPPLVALAVFFSINLPKGGLELAAMAQSLPAQIFDTRPLVNPAITDAVRELQNKTEPGTTIFAAIDTPYALDFKRNQIFTADVAGASTPGQWPLGQGPAALKKHLADHGVRYLLVSDFDNAMLLYTRRHWKEHHRPEWFFKEVWGKYMLDFMDSADLLILSERFVGTAGNLRLVELKNPSPANNP